MRVGIIIGLVLAASGLAGTARAQAPAGGLELSGTSTVGSWTCREPTIRAAPALPGVPRQPPPAAAAARSGMTLSFPVQDIDCGNARMNGQVQETLQADRHPTISFALPPQQLERAVQAGSVPVAVNGTLTIAGRSEPVRTELTVTPAPGHALRVKGEQLLRMSAFGLKPPRLLFGALKVRDLVRVAFDFVLHRPAFLSPGQSWPR